MFHQNLNSPPLPGPKGVVNEESYCEKGVKRDRGKKKNNTKILKIFGLGKVGINFYGKYEHFFFRPLSIEADIQSLLILFSTFPSIHFFLHSIYPGHLEAFGSQSGPN